MINILEKFLDFGSTGSTSMINEEILKWFNDHNMNVEVEYTYPNFMANYDSSKDALTVKHHRTTLGKFNKLLWTCSLNHYFIFMNSNDEMLFKLTWL